MNPAASPALVVPPRTVAPPRPRTGSAQLLIPAPAQDPHVHFHAGRYYYTESSPTGIFLRTADHFADFGASPRRRVWAPPARGPVSRNLWAPELHLIDGRHYIYFAADDGDNARHRMWILGALTADPAGDYTLLGSLDTQGWAIDGTTFADRSGDLFFVWSGWPGKRDGCQNLYIARMNNACELATPRTLLATPSEPWECHAMPICEGPQILRRANRTFLIYSASGSWTPHYCLGLLEHTGGDFLDASNWIKHGCVFAPDDHTFGVGHCGFTTTRDDEDWILYHAKTSRHPGWQDREVRAQPFTWSASGLPVFPSPSPRAALDRTHSERTGISTSSSSDSFKLNNGSRHNSPATVSPSTA